ncbi:ABC transporter ATP-binding protein [Bariatricus massiliensis]|uniref:ABC transporter ATP-binding protein n=1 Tax=Bariatricus massiliensis TaxID=1745713 RepID=A0ABS8DFX9_9FIRM|nr:ABC transporter ATP-binding protein [Bariatricus massiliensis]MCB7304218.1 ABC transporter ATP-binding protein [Bariatricus massiliensis]MCB7374351.1 ABC transporter ATP-binding protein [Bariatricus massiliensis]MCB7387328.1 ABC transporter ATP-binding protein [Bariatricus massiliensis]MCB7411490.1 ABC transporter ATP-binding protein [Bariatricus massiliensis]MCQ5252564.1 ABC transporter ATP-binding protein [Bariatricus massiliensis]
MIQAVDIQKKYEGFQLNCSMELEEGCITGVVGQNGAGKTTLFKAILGLIALDGGEVKVFGKNPRQLEKEEKECIGAALSSGSFSEYLTLGEVSGICKNMYTKFNENSFKEQCRQFGLPMDRKIKTFSSGMRAKAKVIIAMGHQAKLLILDEPTAGLDVVARDEILELMRDYMEDGERSILISSHISSDLEGLCDDIYMIHKGEIVLHEETDNLLAKYGLIKVDENQYEKLDKQYLLRRKKESFGYSCLTNERQFYLENYPKIVVEKGNIDEVITMTIKGERV